VAGAPPGRGTRAEVDWAFDPDDGTVTFTSPGRAPRVVPVQVLGSESKVSDTWRWAWANDLDAPSAIVDSVRLRELGERLGVAELTKAQFPLGAVDGHVLAVIASGVCGAHGYYRAPHEHGAIFVLLKDPDLLPPPSPPLAQWIRETFLQVIDACAVSDHRAAFEAYLRYHGLQSRSVGDRTIEVRQGDAVLMNAVFDDAKRLVSLSSEVRAASP
jgi:hypothetical protein